MRRLIIALFFALALAVPAVAAEITLSYEFPAPALVEHDNGTVEPVIEGLHQHLVPGQPIVPIRTAWIAIPQGHEVTSVRVESAKAITVVEAMAAWAPHFQPLDEPGFEADPSVEIYRGTAPFPTAAHKTWDLQYKRGVAILPINLYPVRYQPAAQRLVFTQRMTVHVTTQPRKKSLREILPFRGLPADLRELGMRLDNPEMLASYKPNAESKGEPIDYLVIAPDKFMTALQDLVDHKTELFGLRCEIASYETIVNTYPGNTIPRRVRNYIKERYNDGLQFVLIVGDADGPDQETIKMQKLFVTGSDPDGPTTYTDQHMATDQYYGCLDGTYNEDQDNFWGETHDGPGGGDVDLLFDVHTGRFAADELWEVKIMIQKTISFENDLETPWKLVWVAEWVDDVTSAGANKEEVYKRCGDMTIPITRLYDDFGMFSHQNVVNAINSNQYQWLNHLGHANVTINMSFSPGDVSDLTNDKFYLGFSQGCFSGSIDGMSDYGYTGSDSMAEWFTNKTQHGALAYFQNTRYGFYLEGRVDGPSNVYDWELADAFFNDGIPNLAAAMDKAKEDCIGLLSPDNMMRWAGYELFLFGDPQTPMRLNCDNDGDGVVSSYCGGEDCNDLNADINPAAAEICDDGLDNNCDGLTDGEDPACQQTDDDTGDDDIFDDDTDDDTTDDDIGDDDVSNDDAGDDDAGDDDAGDDDATDGDGGDDDKKDDGGCGGC